MKEEYLYGFLTGMSEDGFEGWIRKISDTYDMEKRIIQLNKDRNKLGLKPIIELKTVTSTGYKAVWSKENK